MILSQSNGVVLNSTHELYSCKANCISGGSYFRITIALNYSTCLLVIQTGVWSQILLLNLAVKMRLFLANSINLMPLCHPIFPTPKIPPNHKNSPDSLSVPDSDDGLLTTKDRAGPTLWSCNALR